MIGFQHVEVLKMKEYEIEAELGKIGMSVLRTRLD